MERIRLSETTAEVTAALARLDGTALSEMAERLTFITGEVAAGQSVLEPERVAVVERELRILAGVLATTEENIHILRRLQERKARNEWAL